MEPKKQPDDLVQKHGEMLLELLKQLFLAPLKKVAVQQPVEPEPLAQPGCPNCGITIPEIAKLGRLGCPHCYEFFRQELDAVLKHAHLGRHRHVGKVPKNWLKNQKERDAQAQEQAIQKQLHIDPRPLLEEQIRRLGEKMDECIKREQYEIAGQLRDAIKSLRAQLEQAPPPEQDQPPLFPPG